MLQQQQVHPEISNEFRQVLRNALAASPEQARRRPDPILCLKLEIKKKATDLRRDGRLGYDFRDVLSKNKNLTLTYTRQLIETYKPQRKLI